MPARRAATTAWRTKMPPNGNRGSAGLALTSFQDFDVVLGTERFDGGVIAVGHAVHFDEVVRESPRDDGQEKAPSFDPRLGKVWRMCRGPMTRAPGAAATFRS